MAGIFPNQWCQPLHRRFIRKPIPSLPIPVPSKPVVVPKPMPKSVIPVEELCVLDEKVETEIDLLLDEIFNPTPQSEAKKVMQMVNVVNENIQKNISKLENSPAFEGDTVSKEDLVKLLRTFLTFIKTIENYLKNINQVQV